MPEISAIHREVLVPAPPAVAFAVFTERIGSWWPLADLGVHHDGTVAFDDGRIVETAADGRTAVWGTVTEWSPPTRVAFTWHPGNEPERASRVSVTFDDTDAGTLVTLRHDGWEVFADPATSRDEYGHGWPPVLDRYADAVRADEPDVDPEETWGVLLHAPTSGLAGGVFADPRFGDHVAFLGRMREEGFLVAAGPLADDAGAGMTVLRLPGADRIDEIRRLATEEDASVTGGLFTVIVRPWDVVLHA